MPALSALGRLLGAPGRPAFRSVPGRDEARALVEAGVFRPLRLPHDPGQVEARVLAAIGMLRGWKLVGYQNGVVWATLTTPLMGFVDDVLVLLTPDGDGTLVEACSASRIGRVDLGRNRSTLRALRDVLRRWA